jgi:hypothetical protein
MIFPGARKSPLKAVRASVSSPVRALTIRPRNTVPSRCAHHLWVCVAGRWTSLRHDSTSAAAFMGATGKARSRAENDDSTASSIAPGHDIGPRDAWAGEAKMLGRPNTDSRLAATS